MNTGTLKFYCLGGPHSSTEWWSITGDKYRDYKGLNPVMVTAPEEAEIIIWDGIISPKSAAHINELLDNIAGSVVFLMTGEAATFHRDYPVVKINNRDLPAVFLPPSRVLPEELLEALDECRKRRNHV